jgi:bifunctional DNase/RNase
MTARRYNNPEKSNPMSQSNVIRADIRAVIPTNGGTALFLGNPDKVFMIFIDNAVGAAIAMHIGRMQPPRPQTHDLISSMLVALGAKVERVVINRMQEDTFFARLILSMENEVREKKLVELDARPSDSIALALRMDAPVYVNRAVWDAVEDRSEMLRELEEQQKQGGGTEAEE